MLFFSFFFFVLFLCHSKNCKILRMFSYFILKFRFLLRKERQDNEKVYFYFIFGELPLKNLNIDQSKSKIVLVLGEIQRDSKAQHHIFFLKGKT